MIMWALASRIISPTPPVGITHILTLAALCLLAVLGICEVLHLEPAIPNAPLGKDTDSTLLMQLFREVASGSQAQA